jgi:hypothetical protein
MSPIFPDAMDLTFINGLYFTVVTIETIGFGDFVPRNTVSRVFVAFHSTVGIVNLALAVSLCRETVMEVFEQAYRKRALVVIERREQKRAKAREEFRIQREKEAQDDVDDAVAFRQHRFLHRALQMRHSVRKDGDGKRKEDPPELQRAPINVSVSVRFCSI